MAELSEVFSDLLTSTVDAVAAAEAKHLRINAQIAKDLAGKDLSNGIPADMLDTILRDGYSTDFFAGAELRIEASMSTALSRSREIKAGGGISIGPVKITADLATVEGEQTNSNLTVSLAMRRVSKTKALAGVVDSLQQLTSIPINSPTPAPPAVVTPKPPTN